MPVSRSHRPLAWWGASWSYLGALGTYGRERRLEGRYRLEDRLAASGGWSAWKAIDEILARPVSVITFASGFPRLQEVVTAARAASRDRKSTRLNSSHVKISYAVFCLK